MGEVIEAQEIGSDLGELLDRPLKRRTIQQKIDLSDVPQVVKDALGMVEGQKTFSEVIESDPDVQANLQAIQGVVENASESVILLEEWKPGAQLGVNKDAIEKRNYTIVDLYCMWLTHRTILNTINARNKMENRGYIENERSLRRIIVDYYNKTKPSASEDMGSYNDSLREAAYAAQDKAIEKLAMAVSNKKDKTFKSDFEYAIAIEKLIQAHQLRIENRGWNLSRGNPLVVHQQNNQINIINQNVDSYATLWKKEEKVKSLVKKLDGILNVD